MELNAAFSLADTSLMGRAATQPWKNPANYWPKLTDATADRSAPLVTLGLEALAWNAEDLLRRAGGSPIRVASKSIRVRSVLEAVLAQPGYQGILAFTLAEALWLSDCGTSDDIVIAYPTADIPALRRLGESANAAANVTIMVDSVDQLDLVDAAIAPGKRAAPIRVCLDFDASWHSRALGNIGVLRSPIHEPAELRSLAEAVIARPGFTLVGIMSYEAQIAGVGNAPIGKPLAGLLMRTVQHFSADELAERRHLAISSVREISELEFVNGGGTGSIERTVAEGWITEVTAGSGLFGPHLFDNYQHFEVAPATAFALDVVRNADSQSATLLGGGVDRVWRGRCRPAPEARVA